MTLGDSLSLLDLGSQGLHTANTKSPTAFFPLPISQGKSIHFTHTQHTPSYVCTLLYIHNIHSSTHTLRFSQDFYPIFLVQAKYLGSLADFSLSFPPTYTMIECRH